MTNDELGALPSNSSFVVKSALLEKQNFIIFAFLEEHFCFTGLVVYSLYSLLNELAKP